MSKGVHLLLEVLRFIGAVAASLATLAVVTGLVAVCERAWPGKYMEGGAAEISTGVIGVLLGGILGGMAAAAIARPRDWLWAGLAPALLMVVTAICLAPGMPIPAGVGAAALPLRETLASVTLLLGGVLGAAAVHGLRARRDRGTAERLHAPEA